uniref:Domain of unknown function DB domain-containing protein n=2 Tax=Parascaris univalens TaxID=6257 RepID=A0A914ZDH1_PARUN
KQQGSLHDGRILMRSQLCIFSLIVFIDAETPFSKAIFECDRMPISLCCTSRLRENCLAHCSTIHCVGDSFYKQVINRQLSRVETQSRAVSIPPESPPDIPGDFDLNVDYTVDELSSDSDSGPVDLAIFRNGKHDGETFHSRSGSLFPSGPPLAQTPFPTLTPLIAITDTGESSGAIARSITSSPFMVDRTTDLENEKFDRSDKLTAELVDGSSSLEVLVPWSNIDYDTDSRSILVSPNLPSIPPHSFIASSSNSNSNGMKSSAASEKRLWSIKLTPHLGLTDFNGNLEKLSSWRKVDAKSTNLEENVTLGRGIGSVIDAFFGGSKRRIRPDNSNRNIAPLSRVITSTSQPLQASSTTKRTISTSSLAKITAKCGIAPEFLPCVPTSIANANMVECCRAKLLPVGCQNLCRYDVTQNEIKAALDASQCGILHVAPIVECASGGHDNIDCCRYKQVAQKSGPQCEVFCRAGDGIKGLGLQHLICNTVMNDLIMCHHAGLRL